MFVFVIGAASFGTHEVPWISVMYLILYLPLTLYLHSFINIQLYCNFCCLLCSEV